MNMKSLSTVINFQHFICIGAHVYYTYKNILLKLDSIQIMHDKRKINSANAHKCRCLNEELKRIQLTNLSSPLRLNRH